MKRVRGRAKALAEFERLFVEDAAQGPGPARRASRHANAPEDDREPRGARPPARVPQASLDVAATLGPVIGTHGGPGTLGLFWFADE